MQRDFLTKIILQKKFWARARFGARRAPNLMLLEESKKSMILEGVPETWNLAVRARHFFFCLIIAQKLHFLEQFEVWWWFLKFRFFWKFSKFSKFSKNMEFFGFSHQIFINFKVIFNNQYKRYEYIEGIWKMQNFLKNRLVKKFLARAHFRARCAPKYIEGLLQNS